MKKFSTSLALVLTALLLFAFITSCNKDNSGNVAYSYWQGSIPNSYSLFNIMGEKGRTVTGKPFMVLKYDRVTLQIIDCEFGLSEVTQTGTTTPSGLNVPPEPTLNASTIDCQSKLGLVSPVDLMVGWNYSGYTTKDSIINGYQSFSFRHKGGGPGVTYGDQWNFTYNNVSMVGTVKNLDTQYYFGAESDSNALRLLKQ